MRKKQINRRGFLATTAATGLFSNVSRHVRGGAGDTPLIVLLLLLTQSILLASDCAFPDISGRWIWEGGEINSDSRRTMLFEINQTANKLQGKTIQVDASNENTDLDMGIFE